MSSIIPTPSYTPDPAEATLRRALQFVHPASLYDFLYPSPTTHLENLQYMLRQPRRVTAIRSINSTLPSDAPSLDETKRCLLLPSFTVGPLSFMYHVSEHVKSHVSPYEFPHISRCIQDDQHGIAFKIADLDTGLTEINVLLQHSPGVREHVLLIVATESFRFVMGTIAKGGEYNQQLMQHSLIYTMRILQTQPCPSCGKLSDACACLVNLVRKRYPIDFDRDLMNLASYNVGYDGVCYQAMYEGGVNLSNSVSSVSLSAMFSFDAYEKQKLESWAMWHTLQGRENIFRTVVPEVAIDAPPVDYVDEAGPSDAAIRRLTDNSVSGPRMVMAEVAIDSPPVDYVDEAGPSNAVARRMTDSSVGEIIEYHDTLARGSFSHNVDIPAGVQIEQPMAGNVPPNELTERRTSGDPAAPQARFLPIHAETTSLLPGTDEHVQSTVCRDSGIPSHDDASAPEAHMGTQLTVITELPQPAQLPPAVIPSATPPVQQLQPANTSGQTSTLEDKNAATRPKRMGRPPAPKRRTVTQVVPIAPAAEATTLARVENAASKASDESARKLELLELRKARNRMSAVRSNERKKKEQKQLEDNLEQAKKKEAALREQERELKEANLAMWAQLAE